MSEMVERCAQAAAEDACLLWERLPDKTDMACSHGMPEGCKDYWREKARAVLQAMREATPAMTCAGIDAAFGGNPEPSIAVKRAWTAMITAALEDPRHG